MAIKVAKATSNARRQLSYVDTAVLDKMPRVKSLTGGKKRLSGRNSAGQIVTYHRGGGAKKLVRMVDFHGTSKLGKVALVKGIQYDPGRSAFIALVEYESGEKSYLLAVNGIKKGDKVVCDEKAIAKIGNRMKMKNIPVAIQINAIEVVSGKGGQLCRSAGSYATLLGFDGNYAIVKMPSGESRKFLSENYATIGVVSNSDHSNVKIGKAGRVRHMGFRPTVRGKAKNPCDHPHGGGEGGTSIGMPYPKTPWGAPALGPRTRNRKKPSQKLILSRRKK